MTVTFFFIASAVFVGYVAGRFFEWIIVAFVNYARERVQMNQLLERYRQKAAQEGNEKLEQELTEVES